MKILEGFQKGVNFGGWLSQGSKAPEHLASFITEKDVQTVAGWGCDHVRLPVDYENLETEDGAVKEIGYHYIEKCIGWCRENGLHMVLDLHKTCGYCFADQNDSKDFFDNDYAKKRFLDLWDKLAERFAKDDDIVMFEPLNEVVRSDVSVKWNELLKKCIATIRKHSAKGKILIGGTGYNSPNGLELLPDDLDENIVLNFHCYDPHIFTHQGASWEDTMPIDFRISYPLDFQTYIDNVCKLMHVENTDLCCNDPMVKDFGKDYFKGIFSKAVAKAEKLDLPLYCGEYGVIHNAEPEDTLCWISHIHAAFVELGIGRALWSYKSMGFGLCDEHLENVKDEIIKVL